MRSTIAVAAVLAGVVSAAPSYSDNYAHEAQQPQPAYPSVHPAGTHPAGTYVNAGEYEQKYDAYHAYAEDYPAHPVLDATPTQHPSLSPEHSPSTVYKTEIETVYACAPESTDCPSKTPYHAPEATPCPSSIDSGLTTHTVYATQTITGCAENVTDCPVKDQGVHVVTVPVYTTVCPPSEIPYLPTHVPSIIPSHDTALPIPYASETPQLYPEQSPQPIDYPEKEYPPVPISPIEEEEEEEVEEVYPSLSPVDKPIETYPALSPVGEQPQPYYPIGQPEAVPVGTGAYYEHVPIGTGAPLPDYSAQPETFYGAASTLKAGMLVAGLGALVAFFV